jgi:hypothetical protein
VGELPTVSVQHDFNKLLVGDEVTLAEARRRVDFEIAVPHGLGEPDGVYVQDSPPGGMVSFVWGTLEHPRALLTEFRGQVREVIYKAAGPGTKITPAYVGGEPGYYLSGAPHLFTYFDRTGEYRQEEVRLAGNVLVWERGPLTLRLEADVDKARALAIGRALR